MQVDSITVFLTTVYRVNFVNSCVMYVFESKLRPYS